MQIRSGGRSKAQRAAHRESSDPHRLWDQVHNVRDQYTQGIVPQPLSALHYDLAPIYQKDFGFDKDMGLITDLWRIIFDIVFTWFDGTVKQDKCSINAKAWWEMCWAVSTAHNKTVLFHDL